VHLGGTERPERITYLVPCATAAPGAEDPTRRDTPPADDATSAGQRLHPAGVLLACRLRCSTEMVSDEELQVGRETFETALSIAEDHGGRALAATGIGVAAAWDSGPESMDRALRAAVAIAAGQPRSARMQHHQARERVYLGVGVAGAGAQDAPARLAFRLADLAPPCASLVSHEIYESTVDRFDYQGVSPPVPRAAPLPGPVFRLLGPKPERSGTYHAGPDEISLVGRRHLLQTLNACLDEVVRGDGLALHLVGEPGVGKSRLLRAWLTAKPARQHPCLRAHGVPYGGYPWRAWRRLVSPLWSEDRMGEPASLPAAPALADVVAPLRTMERPAILVMDDLHWIDAPSLEALAALVADLAGLRVLVILAYRPSFVGRAPGEPRDRQRYLRVRGLGHRAIGALIDAIAVRRGVYLPPPVRREIARCARGNPLYAEEAVAYLAETQASGDAQPRELPASLPELLIRRLRRAADRTLPELQDGYRRVSILGSLAGERERVLVGLDALDEQLARWLDRLDVIDENEGVLQEFLQGLGHIDGQLALLSLLLGRQRPHRQRLAQALTRLQGARV